jgi:hypothetical protein
MPPKGSKIYNRIVGLAYTPEGELVPTEGGKLSPRLLEEFQYFHNMDVEEFWENMRLRGAPLSGLTEKAIRNGAFEDPG